MKQVVFGQDQRVLDWVGALIDEPDFGPGSHGIGLEEDGELIAGVVFNMYTGPSICMHVAAVPGSRWMNREFLCVAFAYPFVQLDCNRVTGLVRVDNEQALKFDQHLGFQIEGRLRRAASDGTDMYVLGMLKDECRHLRIKR